MRQLPSLIKVHPPAKRLIHRMGKVRIAGRCVQLFMVLHLYRWNLPPPPPCHAASFTHFVQPFRCHFQIFRLRLNHYEHRSVTSFRAQCVDVAAKCKDPTPSSAPARFVKSGAACLGHVLTLASCSLRLRITVGMSVSFSLQLPTASRSSASASSDSYWIWLSCCRSRGISFTCL